MQNKKKELKQFSKFESIFWFYLVFTGSDQFELVLTDLTGKTILGEDPAQKTSWSTIGSAGLVQFYKHWYKL